MPRFLRRLLALLTIGVLGASPLVAQAGGVAPVDAAHATTRASVTPATGQVRPGDTNLSDLFIVAFDQGNQVRLTFTGVTIVSGTSAGTTSTVNMAGGYADCGGGISVWQHGEYTAYNASCLLYQNVVLVTGLTPQTGRNFNVKFAPSSISFANSAPWGVKVEIHDGSSFITLGTLSLTALQSQQPLSISTTSGTFDTPLSLGTTGGSGSGVVSYTTTNGTASGCSVSGATLTSSSAGTCLVTATKAADSTYSAVSSSQTTVTFAKASRTLSFGATTSYTLSYGDTQQVTATPSDDPSDGTVTYQVSSGSGCTVSSSGLIAVTDSEASCQVSASVSAGTNYLGASTLTPVSVTGERRAISLTGTNPSTSYGTTPTPTTTVTGGTLLNLHEVDHTETTFTFVGTGGTVYGPSTTLPTDAGTYSMTPSSAKVTDVSDSTANYTGNYAISYQAGSLTIGKVSRSLSFTSPSSLTLQYGDTETVVAEPSVGDGVITYSVGSSTACSVNASSGVVTVTSASGTCELSSTIAEGTNHFTVTTSSPVTVTVSTRPISVSVAPQSVTVGGVVSSSPTVVSGALQLSDSLSSATFTYEGTGSTAYSASTTAPTAVGTYSVTPSVAVFGSGLASNYVITYTPGTLEIVAAPPPVVVSGGGGASPAPEVVASVETSREPRTPRALPVVPNTSPLGARTGLNAPAGATIEGRLSQGVPAPEINRQTGELPDLSAGQSLATSAGIPETVSIRAIPDAGIVVMEGADWLISLVLGTSNGSVENSEGTVLLSMAQASGGSATGSGFLPGTLVTVWLFSEPTLAATVTVDDNGEFSAEFLVDARLIAPGEHTLQVQGVGTDGYIKAANLGVLVEQPSELTTESASGLLWWVLGVFVLALVFLFVLLARRGRRQDA